ncbi:MAG: hypothetical protein IJX38_01215 [Clostridia bacterium]|nr:hypothetical protein [Clostridia bacterium]
MTAAINKAIDALGYSLLKKHGYRTAGAAKSYKVRARIKDALKKRSQELIYRYMQSPTDGFLIIWFELREKSGAVLERSQAIKLMPTFKEGGDCGEENSEGKDGSAVDPQAGT